VGENLLNHGGVVDRSDQLHPSGAARTAQDVEVERQQVLKCTTLAAHAGEAVGQHPAGQELAKLPRDELGQAGPVARSAAARRKSST